MSYYSQIKLAGLVFLIGSAVLTGQQAPESTSHYVLGADDQIKINVLGVEEFADKTVRIEPNGDIDLPIAGKVRAGGLTLEELKAKLLNQLSTSLVKPEISIEIVDFGSQPVSIMGAVNHPGVHQLRGHKTLAEVLALADGLRPDAGPHVTISREIRYGPIPLRTAWPDPTGKYSVATVEIKELMAGTNPADNIPIFPHDVISIPTADVIFVIGEVKKPGEITLKDRSSISVLQALSSAEGYGPTPAPQNAKIVRMSPGNAQRTDIPVNLRKIMEGKAEDMAMRPNDILVVPASGPKKAGARALEAAVQAATGVLIWSRP
jgi:polysaccharide export outer membrane protein